MPSSAVVQHRAGEQTVVRFAAALGPSTERWLRDFLHQLPAQAPVVLDFSAVRDLAPVTLGRLAEALTHTAGLVRLTGLDLRQQRLLRYLGFEADGQASCRA